MDKNESCSACNKKLDKDNYKKDRTVCKNCYNEKKRKIHNNNNASIQSQQPTITTNNHNQQSQPTIDNVNTNNNTLIQNQQPKIDINTYTRTLIIRFSNCGKTYLMNHFLLQKEEPFFIITKSLNQYPNIKAQTSDEIQPLKNYENSTVFSTICWYQNKKAIWICFFTRGRHNDIDLYCISQSYFHFQKLLFVIILI